MEIKGLTETRSSADLINRQHLHNQPDQAEDRSMAHWLQTAIGKSIHTKRFVMLKPQIEHQF